VGHGALALAGKPLLVGHAASIGLTASATWAAGLLELTLAAAVALRPFPALLFAVASWKLGTELLFPLSGAPIWEVIERGGSFAAPLALGVPMAARASLRTPRVATDVRAAVVLAAALLTLLPASAEAQSGYGSRWAGVTLETPPSAALRALAEELKAGGHTLLCRHAITDPEATDSGPAREQQRNLNEAGRAQARRMGPSIAAAGIPVGDVRASPMWRTHRDGHEVALSPKAFDLLLALVRREGAVASRNDLMREVWGDRAAILSRTVDAHVAELRRKLEGGPSSPELITTVWKAGYRIKP
jgi:hypothetical protein